MVNVSPYTDQVNGVVKVRFPVARSPPNSAIRPSGGLSPHSLSTAARQLSQARSHADSEPPRAGVGPSVRDLMSSNDPSPDSATPGPWFTEVS